MDESEDPTSGLEFTKVMPRGVTSKLYNETKLRAIKLEKTRIKTLKMYPEPVQTTVKKSDLETFTERMYKTIPMQTEKRREMLRLKSWKEFQARVKQPEKPISRTVQDERFEKLGPPYASELLAKNRKLRERKYWDIEFHKVVLPGTSVSRKGARALTERMYHDGIRNRENAVRKAALRQKWSEPQPRATTATFDEATVDRLYGDGGARRAQTLDEMGERDRQEMRHAGDVTLAASAASLQRMRASRQR